MSLFSLYPNDFLFFLYPLRAFLEEHPDDALIRKNFKKTNLLTGSNLNEGNWFIVYELPDYFSRDNPSLVARDQFADSITKLFKYYPTFPKEINSFGREAIMYRYTPWNDHNNMLDNRNNLDKVKKNYEDGSDGRTLF